MRMAQSDIYQAVYISVMALELHVATYTCSSDRADGSLLETAHGMKEAGELPSYHNQYGLKVGAKVASQWPYNYNEAMLPRVNKYDNFYP